MENLERLQTRLHNIQSVLPILSALRTISLGRWQTMQKQRQAVQSYQTRLLAMIPALLPLLPSRPDSRPVRLRQSSKVTVLAIGTERGLCGRFNSVVSKRAGQYLAEQTAAKTQVALFALGGHLCRQFEHQRQALAWSQSLPTSAGELAHLAFNLTHLWLNRYEAYELDRLTIIYNAYQGVGRFEPVTARLIPPFTPPENEPALIESWPPPIIETDPLSLYTRIVEQWTAISLYQRLLESAVAEHAARFQLMQGATQNAERLNNELTVTIQTARRQAITQEIQMLIAGAGLIGAQL